MKRIIAAVAMIITVTAASAQEGRTIYNRYSGGEGVSAVYISPAMFKLIGNLPDLDVEVGGEESVNIAPLIRTFQGFYMLDISDASVKDSLMKDVGAMISKGRYELLMEVKDEGEDLHIYTAGDEKIVESFVFIASDGSGMQFICIDGAMNRSDIEDIIGKAVR